MFYRMYRLESVGSVDHKKYDIFEMSWIRSAMQEADLMNYDKHEEFPDSESEEGACKIEEILTAETSDDKVYSYKFCSSDGWLITPKECSLIITKLEKLLKEDPELSKIKKTGTNIPARDKVKDIVTEFLGFCKANKEKGFRVK